MRVLNDNEEKAQPQELGFFPILIHAFLIAMGMATVVFAPMPILAAHIRLGDVPAKIASLLGALLAMMGLFQVPLPLVIIGFAFGIYIGDQVARGIPFWRVILTAPVVATAAGFLALFFSAQLDRVDMVTYARTMLDTWLAVIQKQWSDQNIPIAALRQSLIKEGPFLYLAGAMLSAWVSIGMIAHVGWFAKGHAYCATELRKLVIPQWVAPLFVVLFTAAFLSPAKWSPYAEGAARLVSTVLFIQGCITLSKLFRRRNVKSGVRAMIYSVAVSFGFFILVGLGILTPWLNLKTRKV